MKENFQATKDCWCPAKVTCDELAQMCQAWRSHGDTIAFTNGCFDVIHAGHLELLAAARVMGDRLIIGLNPDEWVARHKGHGRPLQSAEIRRAVAHCMARADASIIFQEETAERLLAIIKPTVYVIGSDYRGQAILGAQHCGEVIIMDRLPGVSTTASIARARDAASVRQHAETQQFEHFTQSATT